MYVITGATGNIGRVIAEKLLSQGKKVRAIARDRARLKPLEDRGAEIMPGSLNDPDFLARAFDGATAVFAMIPPDITPTDVRKYQDTIGEAIVAALRKTKVPYVVHLSSIGAQVPEGTGPIAGLHRQEERLNQLNDTNVLHLRPASFMENFLHSIPMIKGMNINGSPMRGDLPIPMIATKDIGSYAAERLSNLDFRGKTISDLLGPRDVSQTEATGILGKAIGKPELPYIQFGYDDAIQGMVQAGISPDVAKSYAEMGQAVNEGLIPPVKRTPQNTTPTTMEEFAKNVFAPAYQR